MSKTNKRGSRKTSVWKSLTKSLIGLKVHVHESSSKDWEGIKGIIIDETYNLLIIKKADKVISIPKSNQVFELEIDDGSKILVEGHLLEGNPEHRIKKKMKTW
ncbi:MAG: ribonuclease P protein component 1 [Candidatus Heimdallarchaeaceae archaeon]